MDDEFKSLTINPDRRARFFKHVILNTKKIDVHRSEKKRDEFVKKLDKLRNVKEIDELHEMQKVEVSPNKKLDEIEKKINRVLDYEHYLEDEEKFSGRILSRLSAHENEKMRLLGAISKRNVLDLKKIQEIEKKLAVIEELKSKIREMQTVVRRISEKEKANSAKEPGIFEIDDFLKKDKTLLKEDEIKMRALKNKLDTIAYELDKREKNVQGGNNVLEGIQKISQNRNNELEKIKARLIEINQKTSGKIIGVPKTESERFQSKKRIKIKNRNKNINAVKAVKKTRKSKNKTGNKKSKKGSRKR